jgi:hypothetical protein
MLLVAARVRRYVELVTTRPIGHVET